MSGRIARRFQALKAEGRAGLVTFVTAGDPDGAQGFDIVSGLPEAGADIIEIGMPFTDPMADGKAIQEAGLRALKAGMTVAGVLDMVRRLRERDAETPVVLMGYFNPIHSYGPERFLSDAAASGVDGLIVVDLPPEEDEWLAGPARRAGLDFIRLVTPTTDSTRLPAVLANASGFLYYVAITGITGAGSAETAEVAAAIERLRAATDLPVAVGFGVKTPAQAAAIGRHADAAVVGSAIVERIGSLAESGGVAGVHAFVRSLADGVRGARA